MRNLQRKLHSSSPTSLQYFPYFNLEGPVLKTFQNRRVSSAEAVQTVEASGESDICKTRCVWPYNYVTF